MKEVTKKFVYDITSMESFYGMIPLDMYVSMVYFNIHNKQDYEGVLIDFQDLTNFLTECLTELFLSETTFNLNDFTPAINDFYISSIPIVNKKHPAKAVTIKWQVQKILITEMGGYERQFKMKDYGKEKMLNVILSSHKYACSIVSEVIRKCSDCKKVSVVGVDEVKEEINPQSTESNIRKFDLNEYEKIN